MTRRCNDQGRALEYRIATEIKDIAASLGAEYKESPRAAHDNMRDQQHFHELDPILEADFGKCAAIFRAWLLRQPFMAGATKIALDRLPDSRGVRGDVTDIRLGITGELPPAKAINLSIKHHHDALKHPRVPRLPVQCGITDGATIAEHKQRHDAIWREFEGGAKKLVAGAKLFRELKAVDKSFVDNNIYLPINSLVKGFLTSKANDELHAAHFFEFLVGDAAFRTGGYYVIKNEPARVVIKHFVGIQKPTGFSISDSRPNTFVVHFDNGWDISFRLHTASSRIYTSSGNLSKSTKYDVICRNLEDLIYIERIGKS